LKNTSLDLVVVIGGYNSSNTANLARICAERLPTYHIADPSCLTSRAEIRHRPFRAKSEATASNWLPATGPISIGLTSGASTPDNLVEAVIHRLEALSTESA
jgi:4-hydroxy-3-methylbut-2-enyl diphosphate reductase